MIRPRFEAIRLEYGCHAGRFDLPDVDRPLVISGRNGTGKTTLLEALLRGLYGFVRRRPEDRSLLQLREPWSGRPAEIQVHLVTAEGDRIVISRNVDSDEVVVVEVGSERELFRGDANPVGVRSVSRHYQDLLREWIGFPSLEPYRETAWIAQGELVDTRLGEQLLRAAAGTHRKVETALGELREAYEAMTLEPIEAGGRKKARPRVVEELREAEVQVSRRLDAARRAREGRRPLLERAADARAELATLEEEIALLEAAYRPITECRTLLAEQREAEARLSALSDASEDLRAAAAELARLEDEAARAGSAGEYPADFEARLGRAEELWDRLARIEEAGSDSVQRLPRSRRAVRTGVAVGGALLTLIGLALLGTVSVPAGSVCTLLGGALLAGAWLSRRADAGREAGMELATRRRREEIGTLRSRLDEISAEVPDPPLTPASATDHLRSFRLQVELRMTVRGARERLREATESAGRLLRRDGRAQIVESEFEPAPVEQHLREAREDARVALARLQLRLEEQPAMPSLPEGVESTVPAIESARDERRARRDELRESLARVELETRDLDRASEDVFQLERELSQVRERRTEAETETAVRRRAWELVRDAYERFRATDQERLLAAVNRRLAPLSGGRLGPVDVEGDLSDARVRLRGRMVPLDSPPLSFGEKHVLLLAIRLGAADFVAGSGVRHPLLVDEPFAHLDEIRAREVWELLVRLAGERQVIVTSQDRLVLDHLGIRPDVELAVPQEVRRSAEARRSPRSGIEREPATGEEPKPGSERPTAASTQAQLDLG